MITNLDAQSQLFLADMSRTQDRLGDAERQITSGKRVNVASDDPDVISHLLRLRSALQKNTQIRTNLGVAQTAVNVSDEALRSSIQILDRALTLAAQGATATQDAASRQSLATDVEALQEQLVAFSRTQSGGTFVFSGPNVVCHDPVNPRHQASSGQNDRYDSVISYIEFLYRRHDIGYCLCN